MAHHHREVSCHDVIVAVCRSDGNGVGVQSCLGVRLTVVLLDADWLGGGGPLDSPKAVGEGREAVRVVARFVVDDVTGRASGRVVASAATILVVGIWDAVLLVVPATSLALGGIAFAVAVVDAWA